MRDIGLALMDADLWLVILCVVWLLLLSAAAGLAIRWGRRGKDDYGDSYGDPALRPDVTDRAAFGLPTRGDRPAGEDRVSGAVSRDAIRRRPEGLGVYSPVPRSVSRPSPAGGSDRAARRDAPVAPYGIETGRIIAERADTLKARFERVKQEQQTQEQGGGPTAA